MKRLLTIIFILGIFFLASSAQSASVIYAVNCGGDTTVGDFVPDSHFTGGATWAWADALIDSVKKKPAPIPVLKTVRYGNFSYTFDALTPAQPYMVRLHFVDHNTAADARLFDVNINGTLVLDDYDVFKMIGAQYECIIEEFVVPADAAGAITIQFVTVKDNAMISAIEILEAPPTRIYTPVYAVSAGGAAPVEGFSADNYFVGGNTWAWAEAHTDSIEIDPAPAEVLKTVRYGNFHYLFPNLLPGENYLVRLHFVDHNTAAEARVMDVSINDKVVLDDYDVFKEIGAQYQCIIEEFVVPASAAGEIKVGFETVKDNAMVSAIEIVQAPVLAINCGSSTGIGWFMPDTMYAGGSAWSYTFFHPGYAADLAYVKDPAPVPVYTTVRFGNFSYELEGLKPNGDYKIRLHFSDDWDKGGIRVMDTYINDELVLSEYDITGYIGKMVADVKEYNAKADDGGFINLEFVTVKDNAVICGIEVLSATQTGIAGKPAVQPESFQVFQNYPNPFNPVTTISWQLNRSEQVTVSVYNSRGQLIETLVNQRQSAGIHSVQWDAAAAASGVYFYKVTAGSQVQLQKCLLMK